MSIRFVKFLPERKYLCEISLSVCILTLLFALPCHSEILYGELSGKPFFKARSIFPAGQCGTECHASTIIELANGDLLAAWWCGLTEGASDVSIFGSRLLYRDELWKKSEVLADVPEFFEGTPVLFTMPDAKLWLFFNVINPSKKRSPEHIRLMFRNSNDNGYTWSPLQEIERYRGFRTRNHPIVMNNNAVLLPLFDTRSFFSIFLISYDSGRQWQSANPLQSLSENIEPTVISRGDGTLYALMRTWNDNPAKRYLWQSESTDYGRTWTVPTPSSIPTVDSSVEMIRLHNGHVVLAFNDGKGRERTPLTLALSLDEGRTWTYKRNIDSGSGSFSYPSLVQSRDGHIHVTYSYNRKFIKHVEVNEDWILVNEGIE